MHSQFIFGISLNPSPIFSLSRTANIMKCSWTWWSPQTQTHRSQAPPDHCYILLTLQFKTEYFPPAWRSARDSRLVSVHSRGCRCTWHRSADLGSWKETNDPRVQVRKLQDKVSKCQDNVKKSKEQYELAVSDINNYNSRYQEVTTQLLNTSSPHWQIFLLLRTWRMCSNVASGRRLRDSRPLKTLYSKYTNVLTLARTKRKLPEPITSSRWWELSLLQVTADIRWVLPHGQQRWSREGPPVVVQHSRSQHAHGLAYLRGMSRSQEQLLWTVSSMS